MREKLTDGAPNRNYHEAKRESANTSLSYIGMTFSGVILRALDNRPPNEDKIRGVL